MKHHGKFVPFVTYRPPPVLKGVLLDVHWPVTKWTFTIHKYSHTLCNKNADKQC